MAYIGNITLVVTTLVLATLIAALKGFSCYKFNLAKNRRRDNIGNALNIIHLKNAILAIGKATFGLLESTAELDVITFSQTGAVMACLIIFQADKPESWVMLCKGKEGREDVSGALEHLLERIQELLGACVDTDMDTGYEFSHDRFSTRWMQWALEERGL